MQTVGVYEAKTHLPQLLERIRQGERITITRHGMPVAVLQPPPTACLEEPARVVEEIREFRKGHRLAGITLRKMIESGRR